MTKKKKLATQRKEKERRFQRGSLPFGAALFATFSRAMREKVDRSLGEYKNNSAAERAAGIKTAAIQFGSLQF
jgi:hypothetical protein